MKKELIIYAGILVVAFALFSFEFMVKNQQNLSISTYKASEIKSIAFDVPANVFFIKGDRNNLILEGAPFTLKQVKINSKKGNFILEKNNLSVLDELVGTFTPQNERINLYVIAENIDNINVINQNGCLAKNVLFNGDRGILEVGHSDIIQFANGKPNDFYYRSASQKINSKATALTSCL